MHCVALIQLEQRVTGRCRVRLVSGFLSGEHTFRFAPFVRADTLVEMRARTCGVA